MFLPLPVSVLGQNFQNLETLSCRFGGAAYTVIARFLSQTTLECVAPTQDAGTVALTLSLNGQQFADIGAFFVYYATPSVAAVEPYRGASEGGTLVTVHGSGFVTQVK